MNLKSRLFKKPWQHKDVDQRVRAVRESDDPELKTALPELAQHDDSPRVRLAALQRINTEPFWLDAALRESDDDIQAAANAFLAREIPGAHSERLQAERLAWFAGIKSPELIRRMAASAADVRLRRAAVERINAQGFLGDCFVSETDEQLAEEILERIDQESTLERLGENLRKKNKKKAQAVSNRLAALRTARGEAGPDQRQAIELVRQVESLARGQGDGDRSAVLESLIEHWQQVESPDPTLQRRFEGAVSIVRASLNRPERTTPSQPESEPEPPSPAAPDLVRAATHIRTTIRQARKSIKPGELLGAWDRAWNQLGQPGPADLELKDEMLPLLRELQVQAEQKAEQKKGRETPGEPAESDQGTGPDEADSKPDLRTRMEERLDRIASALEQGDISQSHDLIRSLRADFDRLPARNRPGPVGGRLQRMEGRLKEMRNWQHWSNNKHRDELIEQIERLPDAGQHPDAVSAALKEARDEWKRLEKLEVLPGDRKRYAAPPGQWRRFQAACKQAFESAKPFFDKRQEVQQSNLEQLQKFVAQGMALATAEQPDGKQMQRTMRKARLAIRRMDDLPPRERGQSAAALRGLMDAISKRLDDVFDQIELTKRRLITEARALAHEKDLKTAIDKAKSLQAQWQQAGTGRRKTEQKLWEEFREPIDPLFEQLKGERQEQKQVEKQALAELKSLCAQAEELARLDDDQIEEARGRMNGLAEQWFAHSGRPGPLNARFEKAEAAFEQRLEKLRNKARDEASQRLESLAGTLQLLWSARVDGVDGPPVPQPTEADDELSRQLCAAAASVASSDSSQEELERQVEQNGKQARQIAVEMEFLAGMETPPADRQLRMDYQVQRLARRMSERSAKPDLETELAQLEQRWFQSLPHPPAQHPELAERFEKCRNVVRTMTGTHH